MNSLADKPSTFLLFRTDRIGDVILSVPVAKVLKQTFPEMAVHFLVHRDTVPIVECSSFVDKFWIEDNFSRIRNKVAFLRRHQFDGIIFLHPELDWAFAAFLSGIPLRLGTGYRAYSFLFNHKVYEHRKYGDRHEADLNMDLVKPLGIEDTTEDVHLTIPDEAIQNTESLLAQYNVPSSFVVLHPGSGGSALDWPLTNFAKLADLIKERLKISVVFTGAPEEKSLIDDVVSASKYEHIRLDGKVGLKELAALLQKAEVVVANSTGPLHLAVAMGTDVVGLYCPERSCHPNRWGPYGQKDAVMMPPLEKCDRCNQSKCKHFNCMELILVEEVFNKVKRKISNNVYIK